MRTLFKHATVRTALALAATAALAPAHAGLVSGNWDPLFGPALPGLSWAVQAEFFVPDACIALGDGTRAADGACGSATVNSAWLRLYGPSQDSTFLNDFSQYTDGTAFNLAASGSGLKVESIRVINGQVAGVGTNRSLLGIAIPAVTETQGNYFTLGFTTTAPDLRCLTCFRAPGEPLVRAELAGLEQILITFNDQGGSSNPQGLRLDFQGNPIPAVPEPATAAMALAGLALLATVARRRRQA